MHDHAGHAHTDGRQANRRRLLAALVLTAIYTVAEAVGGWWTGSLALLADAGHSISDVTSLGLAIFASWYATRPPTTQRTYGHSRAEILAALAHGATLFAVAAWIGNEAVERLTHGSGEIIGAGMIAVAAGALAVNGCSLWILESGRRHNLNVRGAWLHVLTDALGSVGVIAAGALVWAFDWRWADPVASLAIAGLVVWSAWHLMREAVDVLMETAPRHLDVEEIRGALGDLPAVEAVHDLHVWTIGNGEISLSSHVVARELPEPSELLGRIQSLLASRFGIRHATIQVESDASCEVACDEDGDGVPGALPAAADRGRVSH